MSDTYCKKRAVEQSAALRDQTFVMMAENVPILTKMHLKENNNCSRVLILKTVVYRPNQLLFTMVEKLLFNLKI